MLSSSPSLLLSTLSPALIAGETAAPAAADAAPGFAALLNGLAAKAGEAISCEKRGAEQTAASQATGRETGKAITVRAGRLAVAAKTGGADKSAPAAAGPAEAAIESGKILPVALPEAAAAETPTDRDAAATAATIEAPAPLPAPAQIAMPAAGAEPARTNSVRLQRQTADAPAKLTNKVSPPAAQPAGKATPEAQPAVSRPLPAVTITVAAPAPVAATSADEAAGKPAAPVRSKPTRAADLARVEAPLPQASAPSPLAQFAQAEPPTPVAGAPVPSIPAPMPSPTEIDAALDQLVAAREALMPAEAALAIDHADFGEVSIKFEQSPDGSLSAELTGADPELKRAVAAATATDRGAMTPDGDGGRSAPVGGQRGSAAGSDAAAGERGQSGSQAGTDRDAPQRRAPAHAQARPTATDQRPGVFA